MIDILYLSILFLTPGLLASSILKLKNQYLLTSSLAVFFWGFSSVILQLNYLINNKIGNYIIFLVLIVWLIISKDFKNLIYNISFLVILESVNNYFGILHIVSTAEFSLQSAIANLSLFSTNSNDPSIQVAFLKFFNLDYILLTIPQLVGFSLMIFNINSIIKISNLPKYFIIFSAPTFTIFCVLLEVLTVRSHFFSSQILGFLVIECLKPAEYRLKNNVYLVFVCLFLSSRLENIFIYFPMIFILLNFYYEKVNLKSQKGFALFISTTTPLFINFYGYSSGEDLRSNVLYIFALVVFLNLCLNFKDTTFFKFIFKNLNLLYLISLLLMSVYLYEIYNLKAINSWLLISNHLLDTHRGWVVVTCYFIISVIYLLGASSKYFNQKLFTNFLLTFFLIVISAPLQHSVYGRDQWANGITDGLAIYNPYDESQTRSFLQLLLSIIPITLLLIKDKKHKIL